MDKSRTVCYCLGVTVEDIINALDNGAKTCSDVRNSTGASAACGRCEEDIKEIIEELKKK